MTWKGETTKKGKRLPPPLPMYETVKLKHVPTMVRRRYDKDLNVIDDANNKGDGKNEGDGVEDDDYSNDAIDVDDDIDNVDNSEGEDDTQANFEHDESHPYREDVGDIKSQVDNNRDFDLSNNNVDASVEDDIQDLSDMNDHGSYSKIDREDEDEDEGSEVVDVVSSVHDNEEGSISNDRNDEDDGPKAATLRDEVDDSVKNEVQCNEQGSHKKDNISEDDGTMDGNVADCYENCSVQDEIQDNQIRNFDNEQGLPGKDDKSEGDETEDLIHDSVDPGSDNRVFDEAVEADDDAQANFHTKYDIQPHITENFDAADDSFESTASNSAEENKFKDEIEHTICANSAEENKFKDEIEHTISANDSAEENKFKDETEHTISANDSAEENKFKDETEHTISAYDSAEENKFKDETEHTISANDSAEENKFKDETEHTISANDSAGENKFKDETEHTISANDSAGASVVEDCIEDHEHEKSDTIDQGSSCSKDFQEDDIVMNNVKLASDVDTRVKDGVEHHEQALQVEDRKSDGGGARDVNGGSNEEGESVKIQEIIENNREIDIKQGLNTNNNNNDDGEEAEDDIVSSNRDVVVETNVQDTRLGASNDKKVLTPETFMETLERDGYELYCPNCNHSITRTILFRRREDYHQQGKTSCFSFLGSLFCCSRW